MDWPLPAQIAFDLLQLVDLEVYHIDDLEVCPIEQHHMSSDKHVLALRGRRRQPALNAVWENRAMFEAWTKSEAFRAAHSRAGDNKPLYLDHPQFEWQFQRQLYDALHDYLVEMFIRTPQDLADRRSRGL